MAPSLFIWVDRILALEKLRFLVEGPLVTFEERGATCLQVCKKVWAGIKEKKYVGLLSPLRLLVLF